MEQPNLGKRISEIRKAKGLTQQEFAEQCKVSARTLQRIENGVVTPRAYTVRAIFAALDSDFPKKDNPFMRIHFELVCNYLKDLFNLKINTMKKVSILTVAVLATGFGLFALCSKSNAQNNMKYVSNNGRGIIYLFPRDLTGDMFISNVKDTALYKFGKYRIQEYKKQIFLDGEFIELVEEGDTVILNKGTLFEKATITVKKWSYTQPSMNGQGIIYKFPRDYRVNYSRNLDEYEMFTLTGETGYIEIKESKNKIFLNNVYKGDAFANDTVILRPRERTLTIKNKGKIGY